MRVVGIDLAGSQRRITGVCVLGKDCSTHSVRTDEQILSIVRGASPACIAIDAPLSFDGRPFRECESELRQHFRILPLTFRGMRMLTERGMGLAATLRRRGYGVIEVYPHASKVVLEIDDVSGLERYCACVPRCKDELDAVVCALTALFYLKGEYVLYGGEVVVPRPSASEST